MTTLKDVNLQQELPALSVPGLETLPHGPRSSSLRAAGAPAAAPLRRAPAEGSAVTPGSGGLLRCSSDPGLTRTKTGESWNPTYEHL